MSESTAPDAAVAAPLPSAAAPVPTPLMRPIPFGGMGLAFLMAAYTLFLLLVFHPGISEPDDNGYYAQATLLAKTGHTWFVPQSDAQYIGIHWLLTPSGKYVSRYPPGLAVIVAGVYLVLGWKVAVFTNPLLAIAGLAGMYFFIKQVLTRRAGDLRGPIDVSAIIWALAGTAILAVNPQFLHHALAGDAHTGVACFLLWGLYFLVKWADTQKLWYAFWAGVFLGVIPTIRYADGIMGLGAAIFMLCQIRRVPGMWKHYALAAVGVAIPLVPLLIRNQLLMGAFWRTGYSLTSEESGFGWDYFKESALPYLQSMNGDGIGLLFGLGWAGMITMVCISGRRALGAAMAAMAVPMLLVYMAYYWGGGGSMTMRFMLPTFGLYIAAGLWLVRQCTLKVAWPGVIGVALGIVGVQFLWGYSEFSRSAQRLAYQKEMLTRITVALEKVAQPGDVVVTNNAIAQQLDFVRKWKVADQDAYRMGPPGGMGGGPGGPGAGPVGGLAGLTGEAAGGVGGGEAPVSPEEALDNEVPNPQQVAKMRERSKNYSGSPAQREQKFMKDVAKWAGDHKVWLVGQEGLVMQFSSRQDGVLPQVVLARRVELPDAPAIPLGPGPGGARGGRGGRGPNGGGGPNGQGPMNGQPNPNGFNPNGQPNGFGPNGPPNGGFNPNGQPNGFNPNGGPNNGFGPNGPNGMPQNFNGPNGGNPQFGGQPGMGPGGGQPGQNFVGPNGGVGNPNGRGPGIQGRRGGGQGGQPGVNGPVGNGQGRGQGGPGGGPGGPGGGGPMGALSGLREVVIAEWILK